MLFWTASALSIAMGIFVALYSEERRVKIWFFCLCLGCAMLPLGQWVETGFPDLVFAGARINMTAGVIMASSALLAVLAMGALPVQWPVIILLAAAAAVNIATVWITDAYFNPGILRYPWGTYISANPAFVINPLLVLAISLYGMFILMMYAGRAHPIERNRRLYFLTAYNVLAASMFDYLPHFGIDLFGGMVSPFAIPLFLTIFGYACLRYRLPGFSQALGKASLQVIIVLMTAGSYLIGGELLARFSRGEPGFAHAAPALLAMALFFLLEKTIPAWANRWFGAAERQIQSIVERLGEELISILDERLLWQRIEGLFTGSLGSAFARLVVATEIEGLPGLGPRMAASAMLDCEVLRRQEARVPACVNEYELMATLVHRQTLLGAIGIGRRQDGSAYSLSAINAMRSVGNMVSVALASSRAALELEKRHELDRYLSPQVVDEILRGKAASLVDRRRRTVTVFFSDLKDFSFVADHLEPDKLSTVLNEYFSEMADIAFRHGGLVDKFIGDAIMVLFGTPIELPPREQALRAVTMATEMQSRLAGLNGAWTGSGLLKAPFQCRMGVHTGEATVGSFGSEARADYTAIGSTVNLASRLETACTPGMVLISRAVWDLIAHTGAFVTEPHAPVQCKGFDDLIEVVHIRNFSLGRP